jgi:phage terminase small subunit
MLTAQEKQALQYMAKGFSKTAAARAAGFPTSDVFKRPHVKQAADQVLANDVGEIKVTRGMVTQMLLESHRKSATATEEIAAARELGKLHGLYEPEKIHHQSVNVHVVEEIEHLPLNELLDLAGTDLKTLSPAEYHEAMH